MNTISLPILASDVSFLVNDTVWRAIEHPGYLEETAEAGAIPSNYLVPESFPYGAPI